MSAREQIIEIVRKEGYDLLTACELTDQCIAEFKADPAKKKTYYIGKTSFDLKKKK